MLELKISAWRLPHARALASLAVVAVVAVVVTAVLGLLAPGGHNSARSSAPVPVASSAHSTCAPGSSAAAAGNAPPALRHALETALQAQRTTLHAPAVTAAVVVCGHVVWSGATGVLALGSPRPATQHSLFVLNSSAKTFVAAMVLLEIQDHHLSLSTPLSQFYPWLPNARQITVRMLLNMTSGLRDYLYNPRIEALMNSDPRHHWTVNQILTGLGSGLGPPRFLPGRGFEYSDTNYILLGAILQRITHRPVQSVFQQLIARPLGIPTATFVPSPAAKALIAHPYIRNRDGSLSSKWIPGFGVSTAVWGPVFTDGGLAASSVDVARFANALLGGRLLNATSVSEMSHIGAGDYGFGLRARSFDGHYWLGHRGYFGGFEAEDWTDPSRQVSIAVGTNLQDSTGGPDSTQIWEAITRAYDEHAPATAG
ncbi:MAG TPA: serine hydrolase domain-containing protein [Solirubrobacteraceae bacterium]|nr:serine hydrolase domain-containing protein [Solirubrobacteraceae bacterium]